MENNTQTDSLVSNTYWRKPVSFETEIGTYQVSFGYEKNGVTALNRDSRNLVTRDLTFATLLSVPFEPHNPKNIYATGRSVRRPKENQNRVAGELYALAEAVNNAFRTKSQKGHAVLAGYLKNVLGVNNRHLRNMIIENMRLQ